MLAAFVALFWHLEEEEEDHAAKITAGCCCLGLAARGTASVTLLTGGLVFDLSGNGISVSGASSNRGNVQGQACYPCALDQFGFGAYFVDYGPATFNGQPAYWQGVFLITGAGNETISVIGNTAILTAQAAFDPQTQFIVCTVNPFIAGCAPNQLLGTFTVSGNWMVTALLYSQSNFPGMYSFYSETWQSAQASPVPEPATLALFAGGAGLVALRRRFATRRG